MKEEIKKMYLQTLTDDKYICNLHGCNYEFTDNDLINEQLKRHKEKHKRSESASKNNIYGLCTFTRLIRCDGCKNYYNEDEINTENDPLCEECYNQQGIDRAESINDLD